MATWWIDYSAKRLSSAVIKGTSVGPDGEHPTGVIRYIDAPGYIQTKHTDKPEYDDLVRSGLSMEAMYFEIGRDDPLGGYAGGQENARRALAGANYLGYAGVVLFCCDRWMNEAGRKPISVALWRAYLDGAVSVMGRGRVGAYGFADAIDAAVGHVDFFVQCGSRSVVRSFVNGWQDNNTQPMVGGIQTDRVQIFKSFTSGGSSGRILMSEDEMATLPAAMDTNTEVLSIPPAAQVSLIFSAKTTIFGGHIYCWTPVPDKGTGGDPVQWRTEVKEGEEIKLPRGTSKAHIEYSCASPVDVYRQAII